MAVQGLDVLFRAADPDLRSPAQRRWELTWKTNPEADESAISGLFGVLVILPV